MEVAAGLVFVISLTWQLTRRAYQTKSPWFCVVVVSVSGTVCADVAHVGLGITHVVFASAFALVLFAIFATWHRVEGTFSIHSDTSLRRELFYWAPVATSFALGTATGDKTATTLHLGYVASGVMFASMYVLPGLAYRVAGLKGVAAFWISYVLTCPLGDSYADWLGVTHARGSLNWGPGNVALMFSLAIVIGVLALRRSERTKSATPPIG